MRWEYIAYFLFFYYTTSLWPHHRGDYYSPFHSPSSHSPSPSPSPLYSCYFPVYNASLEITLQEDYLPDPLNSTLSFTPQGKMDALDKGPDAGYAYLRACGYKRLVVLKWIALFISNGGSHVHNAFTWLMQQPRVTLYRACLILDNPKEECCIPPPSPSTFINETIKEE